MLVADTANDRIRRIDENGTITTFAGGGGTSTPTCGVARTALTLTAPEGVSVLPSGDVVVANTGGSRLVYFNGASGQITGFVNATFVGTAPSDVEALSDGSVLMTDRAGRRVLRVQTPGCGGDGVVTTLAGNGGAGATGDGGPATAAAIGTPESVSAITNTDFLVADSLNGRVRRVAGGLHQHPARRPGHPHGRDQHRQRWLPGGRGGRRPRPPVGPRWRREHRRRWSRGRHPRRPGRHARVPRRLPGGRAHRQPGARACWTPPRTPPRRPSGCPVGPPVLRRTAVVERVRGIVSVRPRGKKTFVRLTDPALVRVGSEIDVERGVARLTVASDTKGTLAPATVRGGRFVLTQGKGSTPITQLALSRKLSCVTSKARRGRASIAAKRRKSRRLWVQTRKKRYRTKGRYATGTVRGTRWLTSDGCRSTRIQVTRGVVTVRDLVRKRNRAVRAGRSYTATRR